MTALKKRMQNIRRTPKLNRRKRKTYHSFYAVPCKMLMHICRRGFADTFCQARFHLPCLGRLAKNQDTSIRVLHSDCFLFIDIVERV
jgi:hypothetical protein